MTTDQLPPCPPPAPGYDGPHIVMRPRRSPGSGAWFRQCCCSDDATAWGWTPDEATDAAAEHLAAGRAHAEAQQPSSGRCPTCGRTA